MHKELKITLKLKILREVVEIRNNLIKDYSPEHAEALNYLAISLRKQNKLEKAMLEHEKVLKIMGNIVANNPLRYQN